MLESCDILSFQFLTKETIETKDLDYLENEWS